MYLIQHDIVSFSSCATVNSLQSICRKTSNIWNFWACTFVSQGILLLAHDWRMSWTQVAATAANTHLSYKSCKSWKLNQQDGRTEHRGQSSVKVMALICSKFPFSCIGQVKLMRVLHERAPICDKALIRPQSQLWLLRFFKATRSQDWFASKIWQSDKCSWKCNFNCALLKQMYLKTATRRWELAS
jgi:hypothetical protein